MSSAIEVLKDWLKEDKRMDIKGSRCPFHTISIKERDALDEAIVALEKQEELKEFISGKITDLEMKLGLNEDVESKDLEDLHKLLQNSLVIEKQIEVLKEVLGKVGEQK